MGGDLDHVKDAIAIMTAYVADGPQAAQQLLSERLAKGPKGAWNIMTGLTSLAGAFLMEASEALDMPPEAVLQRVAVGVAYQEQREGEDEP